MHSQLLFPLMSTNNSLLLVVLQQQQLIYKMFHWLEECTDYKLIKQINKKLMLVISHFLISSKGDNPKVKFGF